MRIQLPFRGNLSCVVGNCTRTHDVQVCAVCAHPARVHDCARVQVLLFTQVYVNTDSRMLLERRTAQEVEQIPARDGFGRAKAWAILAGRRTHTTLQQTRNVDFA